ncbi:MAG: hypothetical protein WD850_03055 [Candidatus Spechtbacterales bacterium]
MISLSSHGVAVEAGQLSRHHHRFFRFLEFFIVGFLLGVFEDVLVVVLATDAEITRHTLIIAALVALPFAVLSELIVDLPFARRTFKRYYLKLIKSPRHILDNSERRL